MYMLTPARNFRIYSIYTLSLLIMLIQFGCISKDRIDRFNLVSRNNIENSVVDSLSSLSVGNGDFTFTVDVTGLQTFPDFYSKGISLGTMSNWGWHTSANPENFRLADVCKTYDVHGRPVEYVHQFKADEDSLKALASDWLRNNPHRIHLGMIGLHILKEDGSEIAIGDIQNQIQKLDLWTGVITSRFTVEDVPVTVTTICHPEKDLVAFKISSGLLAQKRLKIKIHFPLGVSSPNGYDFNSPEKHSTSVLQDSADVTLFERLQDNDNYFLKVLHKNSKVEKESQHIYYLAPEADTIFEFSCRFSRENVKDKTDDYNSTFTECKKSWEKFWSTGGAVDFSECTDPRAGELERRVILSRYLTRIQCSGTLPPAETGLTFNSWFGKFHLEMHWWHAVHFALWQKEEVLEKQMDYYFRIFENARATAKQQGYEGVRWPKMTSPSGLESPSNVGTYLIWQQPHVIFFSELLYQNSGNKKEILNKYKDLVFSTADFMASYAYYDTSADRYVLGPVLIPAQESLKLQTTVNPSFELVYWYWGLKTACEWRSRLHLEPVAKWEEVKNKISELPVSDGLYLCSEDTKDSYSNKRYMSDHPIVSGINGVLPKTRLVNNEILSNSLDTIEKKWNWQSTWGWDFPMLAMSAAAVGRPEQAMDFLMMETPKNRYLMNGHNYQDSRLLIYLPGNGGVLTAVARMCTLDQFPHNGKWNVRWEDLNEYVK